MTDTQKKKINLFQYLKDEIKFKEGIEIMLDQSIKLTNSIKIGFKTLFYSKKWLIYLALSFIFIPVIIYTEGLDFRVNRPDVAFADIVFEMLLPVFFIFGCLLISLPISADEISDHLLELYLVRPIKREVYWLSRWIVVNIFVYTINIMICFIYFLFVHI
ncbi:MAG: hypothetical protein ACFFAO_13450, partial [Candidatus Hermodarchaeota archaeon]